MPLNQQELDFIESIKNKIKDYGIKATVKEAVAFAENTLIETTYNDKTTEIIDIGIERFLCGKSPNYFINRYCYVSVPNIGIIPFSLYYFQSEVMKEIFDFKKYVFLKTRQCLTEDNFVMTKNDGYVSIKDVKVGDEIETIIDDKPSFVKILDAFPNGKKEIVRVLTNSGLTIDCTTDHKIYTKRGWIEAGDLNLKDEILSIIGKGSFGNFSFDDDSYAAFMGYYLADGRGGNKQPSFVNTNLDYINEMKEAGEKFENCFPHIEKRKNEKNRKQGYDVYFTSNTKNIHIYRPVKEFIKRFGLNKPSTERCLTNEIMDLNEKQMSVLLNRLYAGDGWVTYKKDPRRKNYIQYEVGIGSPCFKLIKQIEYILQTKYNIHGYIMETFDKRNQNGKRFWKFRINQKKSVIDFINKIGIKGKTDTEEIKQLIENEEPYKTNQSFEKIRSLTKKEETCEVYDITTESSDFLTNGLLVHNCGISTVISFYCLWRCLFRNGEDIAIVSKRKDAAQDFITKMKVTLDYIPTFLRQEIEYDNMSSIAFKNNSRIKSEARSSNAGRSGSLSLLVLDEAAFYGSDKMTRDIVASAMPTLTRTGGSLILISTPNGMYGEGAYYFEQVQQLKSSGNTRTEKLVEIDWYEVPDIEGVLPAKGYNEVLLKYVKKGYFNNAFVRKEMREYFRPVQQNWKENEWLRTQYNTLQDVLFKQEILHDFITMGSSVFSKELLERVFSRIKDPVITSTLGNGSYDGLWIWKPPIGSHRYIVCCLPGGEKVLTSNGLKNIEEVSLDDRLYGKDGNEISIVNKQIYPVKEESIYKIKIRGIYDSTSFTGEHPLLISKHSISRKHGEGRKLNFNFKFKEAKEVYSGDWVVYPNVYGNETITEEQMRNKFNIKCSKRFDFNLKDEIILDEEIWWYIGIWLAEGWVTKQSKIITAHNSLTEKKYGERIKKIFDKYGRKVGFIEKENVLEVYFNSSHFGNFLNNNFGKGSLNKNIPEWIKFIPKRFKLKLIEGYLNGDGCLINGETANFVSVSKKLLKDIQDILFSLGITSYMSLLRRAGRMNMPGNRTCNNKETYQLCCGFWDTIELYKYFGIELKERSQKKKICSNFISKDNKYIYLRIDNVEIKKYTGKVYNFETEDHTFLCNYLTTHNCDVATGTGDDFSAIQVFDVGEYEQVAEYYGHITTPNYAFLIKKLATYYNQGYVVVESNSIGEAVFNQLYYNENEAYRNVFKQERSKNGISRMTGWITDVKTRKLIVNELIDWISVDDLFDTLKVYSSRLHNELTTWIWQKDKAIHTDGAHDDLLIAMSLALYLRNKATQSGVSFLIAENGNMLSVTREDGTGIEDGGLYGMMCDSIQDKNDIIQEKYNMDIDTYAWLSK